MATKNVYVLEKIETDKNDNAYYSRLNFKDKDSRDNYLEKEKTKSKDIYYTKYMALKSTQEVLSRNLKKED